MLRPLLTVTICLEISSQPGHFGISSCFHISIYNTGSSRNDWWIIHTRTSTMMVKRPKKVFSKVILGTCEFQIHSFLTEIISSEWSLFIQKYGSRVICSCINRLIKFLDCTSLIRVKCKRYTLLTLYEISYILFVDLFKKIIWVI